MRVGQSCLLVLSLAFSALLHAGSHEQKAEEFLKLVKADRLVVPVYAQVQQMFAQGFAQAGGQEADAAVLEHYQARANGELDKQVSWPQIKPQLVTLYTQKFTEQELTELLAFYRSPLGDKVLNLMPALTQQSAELTQARIEQAVPAINKLMDEMTAKLQKGKDKS
ncbi:hypothetical protein SAMN05216214_11578 [Atopomonas hussainii]|uniref:DUF2059 domain-containing protein n=1 Tax=Atopomonas hussainii TaxID=1429083 RepID=A0A1H7RSA1_9GAMM|nr:DUF2059 domain-containing protein [Atopomonas hussainii]SEL62297.1 hypothetical protein SAMN05216214_11578 [Atopomonas hussainii]